MKTLGYKQCNEDHTVFFQHSTLGGVKILIVYVDDIIISRNDSRAFARFKDHLTKHFEVKKLGPLKRLLGMQVAQSSNGLVMTKQKYILDLLEETKYYKAILLIHLSKPIIN